MSRRLFYRSFARYFRRALAVTALGCVATAVVAAYCPSAFDGPAQPVAPLGALEAAPSSVAPSAEDKLASHRAALTQRQAELQSELADVDACLQQNQADAKTTAAKIASLSALLAAPAVAPARIESLAAPPAADVLRQQLDALHSREHDLAVTMHDNHPRLLAVRQQLEDLQASLREIAPEHSKPVASTPEPRTSTGELLAAEQVRAQGLVIHRQSLLGARVELQQHLSETKANLAAVVAQSDRAAAEMAVAEMRVPSAPRAAVAAAPLASATVLLPALRPANIRAAGLSSSGRATILAAGALLAALLGLLTAVISAARNPLLCTPRQLETLWDVPLAGTIPPDLRPVQAAD